MKKKSVLIRVGVVAAALTMVSTSLMSGTLAKYTTEATTTAQAIVANFGPKFRLNENTDGKEFTESTKINLGDSKWLNVNSILKTSLAKDTAAQTAAGNGAEIYKLAPGVSGTIPIFFDLGSSEVDVKCGMSITKSNVNLWPENLKLYYQVGDAGAKTPIDLDSGAELDLGVIKISDTTKNKKVSLIFEWPYEAASGDKEAYNNTDSEYVDPTQWTANGAGSLSLDVKMVASQASSTDVNGAGTGA